MNFSESINLDRMRNFKIMKKRNHPEISGKEMPTPCAR